MQFRNSFRERELVDNISYVYMDRDYILQGIQEMRHEYAELKCNICSKNEKVFYYDGDIAVCEQCYEEKNYNKGLEKAIDITHTLIAEIGNAGESFPLMRLVRKLIHEQKRGLKKE